MTNDISHTSITTVTEKNTALAMGSGDLPVFATPALVSLMENAAMLAARQLCSDIETTVGASIEVKHLRPSPINATITATALLAERDQRKLTFSITAHDGENTVGTATHIRYIVNRDKFMNKL